MKHLNRNEQSDAAWTPHGDKNLSSDIAKNSQHQISTKEEIKMKVTKLIGFVVALALLAASGGVFALGDESPQTAFVMQVNDAGQLQIVYFLDLNGNGKLDAGEKILQIITVGARLPESADGDGGGPGS